MYLEKMKGRHKLFKNCSIHGKIVKFLVSLISGHPQKTISLVFETEIIGPSAIDVGGMTPCPPVTMPLCTESSFHVVPYLTRKLFEFIIFFYLTIISL